MIVYVELMIFNNMCINLAITYVVNVLIGARQIWWRLLLSASLGTAYALVSPIIDLSWEVVIKLALSAVMCWIMTSCGGVKYYAKYLATFYMITFLLGGCVMALGYMSVGIKQALNSPTSVIFGVVALVALVMLIGVKYYMRCRNKAKAHVYMVDVLIGANHHVVTAHGLLDSGNRLYYRGIYPVIAMNKNVLKVGKSVGNITVITSNGAMKKPLYAIDFCRINGKRYNAIYAMLNEIDTDCDVILHSSML